MRNTENNFQQELSRSYSIDLPMELKRNQFNLDNVTPRMRYSLNQQANRQRMNADKSHRLSLNHAKMNNSPVLLRNRQVCRFI